MYEEFLKSNTFTDRFYQEECIIQETNLTEHFNGKVDTEERLGGKQKKRFKYESDVISAFRLELMKPLPNQNLLDRYF